MRRSGMQGPDAETSSQLPLFGSEGSIINNAETMLPSPTAARYYDKMLNRILHQAEAAGRPPPILGKKALISRCFVCNMEVWTQPEPGFSMTH